MNGVSLRGDAGASIFVDSRHIHPERRALPSAMVDFPDESMSEEELDDEFPLGDGTAETETIVYCPHCGQANEVALDPGSGGEQEYVEDCQICCRPWLMYVKYERDGSAVVDVYASDS